MNLHHTWRLTALLASMVAAFGAASSGEAGDSGGEPGGKRVQIGMNDWTGKPVYYVSGRKHPRLTIFRGKPKWMVLKGEMDIGVQELARIAAKDRTADARGMSPSFWLYYGLDQNLLTPEMKEGLLAQIKEPLLTAGWVEQNAKGWGPRALEYFYAALEFKVLTPEQTAALAKTVKLRLDGMVCQEKDGKKTVNGRMFMGEQAEGGIRRPGGGTDVADLIWDLGVISDEEKASYKEAVCNVTERGRRRSTFDGGTLSGWKEAVLFDNAAIMAKELEGLKNTLGHHVLAHGGPSCEYDHVSLPVNFGGFAEQVEGIAVAGYCDNWKAHSYRDFYPDGYRITSPDFKAPSLPRYDATFRDGLLDTRSLKEVAGVIWKDVELFNNRHEHRKVPDGSRVPYAESPSPIAVASQPMLKGLVRSPSVAFQDDAALRAGPIINEILWGRRTSSEDAEDAKQTIYCLLHTSPSEDVHTDYDTLALTLWHGGKYLLADNGCECDQLTGTYCRKRGRYAFQSYAHNTLVVDQQSHYVTDGEILFFSEVPGFKAADSDAGYAYDDVFIQRTVALTDDYLLDLNLALPRAEKRTNAKSHTFDYLLQGNGRDYTTTLTEKDEKRPPRVNAHSASLKDNWLVWPNLNEIYPYIRWRRYVYEPRGDWEWGFNEDGVGLRTVVFKDGQRTMRAALGMAELSNRDVRITREKELLGVPKLLARYEGDEARFLTILEPYREHSKIESYQRIDERAVKVALKDRTIDYLFVKRTSPKYLLVKVRAKEKLDAPQTLVSLKALGDVKEVRVGEQVLASLSAPVSNLSVDIEEELDRNGKRSGWKFAVYATASAPVVLTLPFLANKKIELKKGVHRAVEKLEALPVVALPDEAFAALAAANPPAEVKEREDRYAFNRAKPVLTKTYIYPYVYGDGAYDGLEKNCPWQTAISDDGKTVVYGGIEHLYGGYAGIIDCFKDGKPAWRYYPKDNGRAVWDYNGGEGCFYGEADVLKITGKGDRVYAGTDKGYVECLDGNGAPLWAYHAGGWVNALDCTPDGSLIVAAAGQKIILLARDGRPVFEKELPKPVTAARIAQDGKTACCVTREPAVYAFDAKGEQRFRFGKANVKPFSAVAISADGAQIAAASGDSTLYLLDRAGKPVWEYAALAPLTNVAMAADASRIAFTTSQDDDIRGGAVYCLDGRAGGKLLWKCLTPFDSFYPRMTPDGKCVGFVMPTGTYYLVSGDGQSLTRTPIRWPEPAVLAITPDGRYTSLAGIGYEVQVFENPVK